MTQIPIPDAPTPTRTALADLALRITAEAKARYALHQRARHRITADLGAPAAGVALNQKLTAWWCLDFPAFRAEVQKVFRRDIALRERDEWDGWLAEQRAAHERHTAEIVRLETELNGIVYGLFELTAAEVRVVESHTKYRYGEV